MKLVRSALAAALLAVCLLFSSCSFPTVAVDKLENPKKAVSDFIDCLSDKRFGEYQKYVYNYASLGFETPPEGGDIDPMTEYILENIFDSYSISFDDPSLDPVSGDCVGADFSVSGRTATVTFTLTALDASKLQRRITGEAEEIAAPLLPTGYVYDTEEKAFELIEQAIAEIEDVDIDEFLSDNTITVNLKYIDGMWKIEMTKEFFAVLTGDSIGYPIADDMAAGLDYALSTED
ncbi:MAG: hypothetical protein IJP10_03625 [Clostridia bacterium]|nr:hypothetical protein [Clostridia bacterium]